MILYGMVWTLLWISVQPVIASAFSVDLTPRYALSREGGQQELRCRVKDCPERFTISWGLLEDKPMSAQIRSAGSESVAIFDPVKIEHEATLLCKVSCGRNSKQLRSVVKVYAFPKDPVVSGQDYLVLDQKSTLKCEVVGAHPADFLVIEWLRGGIVVDKYEGEEDVMSVVYTYMFTPTKHDTGETVTCRASLHLDGVPLEEKTRETNVSVTVLYAPHIVISEPDVVKVGSNLTLLCGADGNPRPVVQWRFIRQDTQPLLVGENQELNINNVTLLHAGRYDCVASNIIGNQTVSVKVVVQGPPKNTSILVSPANEVKEGERVTVSCLSEGAAVSHMVLRRVTEDQETELQSSDNSSVSFTVPSAQLEDSGIYECVASNKHSSQRVRTLVTIETHPLEVELEPGVTSAEMGSSLLLSCQATGCPQPVLLWKSPLDVVVHSGTHTQGPLTQLRLGPLSLLDEGTYTCEAKCGSVTKVKHIEVNVFSFPSDLMIDNNGPFLPDQVAILRCLVVDVYPASLIYIQWLDGEKELFSEVGPYFSSLQNVTSTISYPVGMEDQGKKIVCRVTLEMDGVQRRKEAVTTLQLHYAPKDTSISLNPAGEVKEGERVTVSCLSEGAAVSHMVLRRVTEDQETELQSGNNSSVSFTFPSAQLEDSGRFECVASNELGSQKVSTQLIVRAPPRNTTVIVYPSTEVQEGQNVTVCCHSISFPPALVLLRKLGNDRELSSPDGTFLLVNLTVNDTGLYLVNVTNDLGYETEIFTIKVMEKNAGPPTSMSAVVLAVVCVASVMVSTAALMLDYLRRSRKKGFYELAKCSPGTA